MNQLSYNTLRENGYDGYLLQDAPERVLQFGEGNFLRAFCDYFIDVMNERCGFNSKVVLCQPIAQGLGGVINEQDGLYTLCLRGFEDGQRVERKRVISCVSRCINPYEDFAALLECAHNPQLRYIISNTTEAGIVFDGGCRLEDAPPSSFPAKLTRFLLERYKAGLGGLAVLSCELIDNNGAELLRCVKKYIELWQLEDGFAEWVERENIFCSTLVDRIVTGYPRNEADEMNNQNGYIDKLLVTGECFGFWAIEGPDSLKADLPFEKAGLPVIITPDHSPYKRRKVRILNGAHTSMVPAAFLCGQNIVRDCMDDPVIYSFLHKAVFDEIIPTLDLPREELLDFANAVVDRFKNPFIDHALLSIALNCTSKWRARVLPSIKAHLEQFGTLPACLVMSMAAYIELYRGSEHTGRDYTLADDGFVLDFFAAHKNDPPATLAREVLSNRDFWGDDLTAVSGFENMVAEDLAAIERDGMYATLSALL